MDRSRSETYPNVNTNAIPQDMPLSVVADELLAQREADRRSLILSCASRLMDNEDMARNAVAAPGRYATAIAQFADHVMVMAYGGTVEACINPRIMMSAEITREESLRETYPKDRGDEDELGASAVPYEPNDDLGGARAQEAYAETGDIEPTVAPF